MTATLLLTLAVLLPQEKNQAEELFKKMEEKLLKAQTIHVAFKTSFEEQKNGEKRSGLLSGSIQLDQGNLARLETEGRLDKPVSICIVSDGIKTGFTGKDSMPTNPSASSPTLGRDAILNLTRFGGMSAVMETRKDFILGLHEKEQKEAGKTPAPRETDPRKTTKLSGFKTGPASKIDGRDAGVIQFVVEEVDKPGKTQITLWFDSATLLPIRRRVVAENDGILVEETYSTFKLDEKIDPAKFELPKDAK